MDPRDYIDLTNDADAGGFRPGHLAPEGHRAPQPEPEVEPTLTGRMRWDADMAASYLQMARQSRMLNSSVIGNPDKTEALAMKAADFAVRAIRGASGQLDGARILAGLFEAVLGLRR